ncbi:MAG TPA: GNAT family N-acetyltransferase [Candidatus Limnocylindrales bacterium]|nr:GNAT family N-acetyltransferase [Candidatus Limnocylindrales bacterium]
MAEAATAIAIHPLTPERFADLAALFQEGGDPKWCWCQFYRERGLDWSNSTAADNRERLSKLTAAGPSPGLVAYDGDRAVGWVSLAPRQAYDRLTHAKVLAPVDDKPVWSIVCFVVSRQARGKGVATALLDGAIDWARSQGATILEGYPSDTQGKKVPAANVYHGTLSMFESAGFDVVARRQANRTSKVRPIVRLDLSTGGR